MAENKTQPNELSVEKFLNALDNESKRKDAWILHNMITEITGKKAVMWGPSLVGFDQYHYRYNSGREGDFFKIGFSPRKTNFSVYIMDGFTPYEDLLQRLGKHKLGKACLYINKLSDIDTNILKEIMEASYAHMNDLYPEK